jgi:hypothetical protein
MKSKEDVLFEVYGRTISPSSEMLKAMDGYAEAFAEWLDETFTFDGQTWHDAMRNKKPFKSLVSEFLLQQKNKYACKQ